MNNTQSDLPRMTPLEHTARVHRLLRAHYEAKMRELKRNRITDAELMAVVNAVTCLERLMKRQSVPIEQLQLAYDGLKNYADELLEPNSGEINQI